MALRDLFNNIPREENVQTETQYITEGNDAIDDNYSYDGDDGSNDDSNIIQGGDAGGAIDTQGPMGSRDERFLNRMIGIRGLPRTAKDGSSASFLFDPGFLEQLELNNWDSKMIQKIWRRMADVLDESESEGCENIALHDARSLAWRILSQRGANDGALGANERTLWVESRQRSTSTVKTNQISPQRQSGILSRLFGH